MRKSIVFFSFPVLTAVLAAAAVPARTALAAEFGPATTYGVTLKKIELCAEGSEVDETGASAPSCVNPYVVGSETKSFDIASVAAGAALGSYGGGMSVPAGVTYTHIRLTASRSFNIAGVLSGISCRTDSGGVSGTVTSPAIGEHVNAAGTPQTLVVANVGAYGGGFPTQEEYWENGLDLVDGNDFTITVPMPAPFVSTGKLPSVRVAFNTQEGLAGDFSGGLCLLYPNYPSIDIAVQ